MFVRGAAVVLVVACAPPAVAPPPKVTVQKPSDAPPPYGWSFYAPIEPLAELAVAGGKLVIGKHGRRELRANGTTRAAETLLPPHLVAATTVDGGKLAILTVDGEVHVADPPLGPIVAVRAGVGRVRAASASNGSFLVVPADGGLLRSTDAGVTWSKPELPSLGVAMVVDALVNADGLGLAVAMPQRAYATIDHGATWSRVETPGIGFDRLERASDGAIELVAYDARACLERSPLRLAKLQSAAKPAEGAPSEFGPELSGSLGRLMYRLRLKSLKDGSSFENTYILAIHAPGEPFSLAPAPAFERCASVQLAGTEDAVLATCSTAHIDGGTTKLLKSSDRGKTWSLVEQFEGSIGFHPRVIATGPSGYVYLAPIAKRDAPEAEFYKPRIKLRGKASFVVGRFEGPALADLDSTAIDEKGGRIYFYGTDVDRRRRMYVGTFDDATLRPFNMPVSSENELFSEHHSLTVDAEGVVRLALQEKRELVMIHARGRDGQPRPSVSLAHDIDTIALNGLRGLAILRSEQMFETADAGATWTPVEAPEEPRIAWCSPFGCEAGDAFRRGWKLAPGQKGSALPPIPEPKAEPPMVRPAAVRTLACHPSGKRATVLRLSHAEARVGLDADTLWTEVGLNPKDAAMALYIRARQAPKLVELLPPIDKAKTKGTTVTNVQVTAEGPVAVRYRFDEAIVVAKKKIYAPVDVDLAWLRNGASKPVRASLKKLPPFRVSVTGGQSAQLTIDKKGLFFRPFETGYARYFVRDDGKSELVDPAPAPPGAVVGTGERRMVLHHTHVSTDIVFTSAPPRSVQWTLLHDPQFTFNARDGHLGDQPFVVQPLRPRNRLAYEHWLFPLDAVGNDPPEPRVVDATPALLEARACDAKGLTGLRLDLQTNDSTSLPVTLTIDGEARKTTIKMIGARTDTKAVCIQSIAARERMVHPDAATVLIDLHDRGHGWMITDQGGLQPMVCE